MFYLMLFSKNRQLLSNENGQSSVEYSILIAFFFGGAYFFYATDVLVYTCVLLFLWNYMLEHI